MISTTDSYCQNSVSSGARLNDAVMVRGSASDIHVGCGRTTTVTFSGRNGLYSKNWKAVTGSFGGFVHAFLSVHHERPEKGGPLFVPGHIAGRRRQNKSVVSIDFIVFDIDNKPEDGPEQKLEDVNSRLLGSGVSYVLYTSPSHRLKGVDKFRIVLDLAETMVLEGQRDECRSEYFTGIYQHVAKQLGIVNYDPCGERLSQAYYLPHHLPGAPWLTYIAAGEPLRLPDLPPPASKPSKSATASKRVSLGENTPTSPELRRRIGKLLQRHGRRFDLPAFIESIGWECESRRGKLHIRCPNDHEHSEPDSPLDSSCSAWKARDSPNGFALIKCQHAHCQHLKTADMLTMLVEQVEFEDDMIAMMREYVK